MCTRGGGDAIAPAPPPRRAPTRVVRSFSVRRKRVRRATQPRSVSPPGARQAPDSHLLPMKFPVFLRPATLVLSAVLLSGAPSALAGPRTLDEGDDQYRFLAGLADKELHDMVVREGEAFLRRFGDHPKRDLARYRLASALFALDRRQDALPHFRQLSGLRNFEFETEAWFRLGQCELTSGNTRAARQAFDRVVGAGDTYLLEHARFLSADAAFRGNDYPAAEKGYAEVLRRHPEGDYARDAASGLAWCAWKLQNFEQAQSRIERYLEAYGRGDDPYGDELRVLLGEAHLRAGRPGEALKAYRAVGAADQADAARRGIAFALADLGDHAGAAEAFGTLLQASPQGPFAAEAALHRGIHLLRAGQAEAAVQALSNRAAGNGPEVLYWRAQAQAASGDHRAALGTLDRALEAKPDDELTTRLQMARGDALTELGRGEDAIEAYGAAGSDYALHAAAVEALNGGQPAEAARISRQLLQRFPNSEYGERTRVVLGEALFADDEFAQAAEALAPVVSGGQDPTLVARALSRLAWCSYLGGDARAAAQGFRRLVEQHGSAPEAPEALFMLGRALEESDDEPGAVTAWRRYLAQHPQGADRPAVLIGLGRIDELAPATQAVKALLEEYSDHELLPQALYDLGERASAAGELPTAKACYEALLQNQPRGPLSSPARYGLGWCLLQEENFRAGAERLDEIRGDKEAGADLRASALELSVWAWRKAEEPQRSAGAWRAFAKLCQDERRLFEAAKTAALALRDAGSVDEAQGLLGELLERVSEPQVAVEALVEGTYLALEADDVDRAEAQVKVADRRAPGHPKLAEASFFVAEAHFEAGDDERAVPLYRAATIDGSPVADAALYKLGFAELRRDQVPAAETALAKLVADHPRSELWGEGLFLLGEARFRQEKFQAVVTDLERLRKERPRHAVLPKALFRLGLSYARLERWKECESTLGALLQASPRFENLVEVELTRGTALVALERPRAARQALGRVLSLDGESVLAARAHLQLGRLARGENDLEGALSEFLKVAVLYAAPEEVAEALVLAGECLEEQNKTEAAIARYREAATKYGSTAYGARAKERLAELERSARRQ